LPHDAVRSIIGDGAAPLSHQSASEAVVGLSTVIVIRRWSSSRAVRSNVQTDIHQCDNTRCSFQRNSAVLRNTRSSIYRWSVPPINTGKL